MLRVVHREQLYFCAMHLVPAPTLTQRPGKLNARCHTAGSWWNQELSSQIFRLLFHYLKPCSNQAFNPASFAVLMLSLLCLSHQSRIWSLK